MTDNERIRSFGDMVQATEKLTKPWRLALIITNALLGNSVSGVHSVGLSYAGYHLSGAEF